MNRRPAIAGVCFLALVAGCGQKTTDAGKGGSSSGAPPAGPAASAPAELSPEQARAMVASLPAPYNTGDPASGKAVFARCRACHSVEQGAPDLVGPNLWGLFSRKAGSKAGYAYSDAMKSAGFTWDAPHLDAWLTDPRSYRPGTRMSFVGLKDARDRQDVIAYLKTATEAPPASTPK